MGEEARPRASPAVSALQRASRLAKEPDLAPEERRAAARSALFDEAFARCISRGRFRGRKLVTVSQRKGTHDFYNQNGLEVFTRKGRETRSCWPRRKLAVHCSRG